MKQFFKSNVFIIIVVVSIWLIMEILFYSIVSDAQEAYEKDIVTQAKFYVQEVERTREANIELKSACRFEDSREQGKYLRYALVSNQPVNIKNKAIGFYADALHKIQKERTNKSLYELDEEKKRFYYLKPLFANESCFGCHAEARYPLGTLRGGVSVDVDATFLLDRRAKMWMNFFFVSFLTTAFTLFILFFIVKISRQKFHYFNQNIDLQERLKAKVDKLNEVLKASQTGYWEWNIQTGEHSVDEQWLKILGLAKQTLRHDETDWSERIHKEDALRVQETVQNAIKSQSSYVVEFRMLHADGHYVWIQGSGGVTQRDEKGEVLKLSGTHQDITQRKLLEIEHQKSEAYLNTLFEKNPNIIIVSDGKNIIKANDAFFQFFSEYDSLDAFREEHRCICEYFVHEEGSEFVTNEHGVWMDEVLDASEPVVKIRYKHKECYFAVYAKKVYEHERVSVIVTFNNITETYGLKKRFEELSIVDELTQAHNRRYFNAIFLQETNRAIREKHNFCLAILDIDNFKRYNDNYGHDAGDEVLARFATEVKKIAQRSNEFFFRLGGEEFGLIYSHKTQDEALEYARMICKSIEALEIEHEHNPPWNKFTVSIGVAFMSPDNELNLKAIYKKADDALYRAKANGRNRVEIL